jgi:prepilin-type N-terminal cleavage/methylation domain-containing protein
MYTSDKPLVGRRVLADCRKRRYYRVGGHRKAARGFTIIEVLMATVLVSIAVAATFGAISRITAADAKAQTADLLQRLASEKLNDLTILTSPSANGTAGDFTDRGYPDISWSINDQSTSVDNVDEVTVTATQGRDSQALTTLVFISPQAATGTTGGTGGGGGGAPGAAGAP